MKILLYAPEYRPNLSNMIRTAEFYGFKKIYIYDKNGLMNPPSNKVTRAEMNHMARVWTAGAIEHIDIVVVSDPLKFIREHKGKTIATVVTKKAESIHDFSFESEDILIMGPEKEGLPEDIIQISSNKLIIPHIGITDCLNVSVTLGVVINEAMRQLGFRLNQAEE
ncbi:MAG: TrmH family RNA methyltransferase [Saprospiraceae bacterium]